MILLATTSTVLRVITDAAVTVDVFAIYGDKAGATFDNGNQATAISTATTTTVLAAPAASTQRTVKALSVRNRSASSVTVTVEVYNGATAYTVRKTTLAANTALLYEDRQGWRVSAIPRSVTQQVFTAPGSGTYVTPADVRTIRVECYGAGGGGGGTTGNAISSSISGGGGSGAYAVSFIQQPAATYAYTVGVGGASTLVAGAAGSNGGATSFGGVVIAAGGGGGGGGAAVSGPSVNATGGAGGTVAASTGDLKIAGRAGGAGYQVTIASPNFCGGAGASSRLASTAYLPKVVSATLNQGSLPGINGVYGGGGSGGASYGNSTAGSNEVQQPGGRGGHGVIIVTEYR